MFQFSLNIRDFFVSGIQKCQKITHNPKKSAPSEHPTNSNDEKFEKLQKLIISFQAYNKLQFENLAEKIDDMKEQIIEDPFENFEKFEVSTRPPSYFQNPVRFFF